MPWTTIVAADLSGVMNASEINTTAKYITENQVDVVAESIANTVELVRGYVAMRSPLGQPGTIPGALKSSALAIACIPILTRVRLPVSDGRNKASDDARSLLKSVGRGEFSVEAPENATAVPDGTVLPDIECERVEFSARRQDGI